MSDYGWSSPRHPECLDKRASMFCAMTTATCASSFASLSPILLSFGSEWSQLRLIPLCYFRGDVRSCSSSDQRPLRFLMRTDSSELVAFIDALAIIRGVWKHWWMKRDRGLRIERVALGVTPTDQTSRKVKNVIDLEQSLAKEKTDERKGSHQRI